MSTKKRFYGSIAFTVLIFNILLIFLPVASFFFLDIYEKQLLRSLETGLASQARLIAAALNGPAATLSGRSTVFLESIDRQHEARYRIFDQQARFVADSARQTHETTVASAPSPTADTEKGVAPQDSLLYRLGSLPVRIFRKLFSLPRAPSDDADHFSGNGPFAEAHEIQTALTGRYGAETRVLNGSTPMVILYSALPIFDKDTICGVALVSQSSYRILQDIYAVRLDIFRIFLVSGLFALVLSAILSLTLIIPLRRLGAQAGTIMDSQGRIHSAFVPLRSHNEIGKVSQSLSDLSQRLERHVSFLQSFSQDLAHEIKNPLASLSASLEILGSAPKPAETQQFLAMARRDAARIDSLVNRIREISAIDTEDPETHRESINLIERVFQAIEGFQLRNPNQKVRLRNSADNTVVVRINPQRLLQILDNLLENAASFSPPGAAIDVDLDSLAGLVSLRIRDYGPGFPSEDADRIFERFYSTRKNLTGAHHTGLGLSIVRSLVQANGGKVTARNAMPGAEFTIRFAI